jgi:hypothetical protein
MAYDRLAAFSAARRQLVCARGTEIFVLIRYWTHPRRNSLCLRSACAISRIDFPGVGNLPEAHRLGKGHQRDWPQAVRYQANSVYWFGSVKLNSEAAYLNRKLAALRVTNNSDYQRRICHFIDGVAIARLSRHGAGAIGLKNAAPLFAGIHRSRIADSLHGFGSSDRRLRVFRLEFKHA